jgi:hypothetical protein
MIDTSRRKGRERAVLRAAFLPGGRQRAADCNLRVIPIMSYPYSGSASDRYAVHFELPASRNRDPLAKASRATDRAIDVALRNVPLPNGLMTRLGRLAYTLSDEVADRVDYRGC